MDRVRVQFGFRVLGFYCCFWLAAYRGFTGGGGGGACLRFAIPSGSTASWVAFTSLEQKDLAEELLLSSLILPGNQIGLHSDRPPGFSNAVLIPNFSCHSYESFAACFSLAPSLHGWLLLCWGP